MKNTRKVKLIALGTILVGIFIGSIGTGIYAASYRKEAEVIVDDACENSREFQNMFNEDLSRLQERLDRGYISSKQYMIERKKFDENSYKEPLFYILDDVAEDTKQEVIHKRSVYNTIGLISMCGAVSAMLPAVPFGILLGQEVFENKNKKKNEEDTQTTENLEK